MKRTFLLALLIFLFLNGFSQFNNLQLKYYSARDYGKGHESSNWACVQDMKGVLYFGNAGGLLRYDGINWDFISVGRQNVWIKSLAVSPENKIYVGAESEFGYLASDLRGQLSYVSLSDKLAGLDKKFSSIHRVWVIENLVVFQSEEALFLYRGDSLTVLLPETSFHLSFLVDGKFYVRQRGIGVMRLTDNKLRLVEGGEFFKDMGGIRSLKTSDPSKFIFITREDGFWLVDKNTFKATELKTPDKEFLQKSEIYDAVSLSDGRIALATLSNGIVITDENLNVLHHLNKDLGLRVNGVLSVIQDYQGNLWAGLDNGIAQIFYLSPVKVYGSEAGISGNISSIVRFENCLYVGTTDGLFVSDGNFKQLSLAFHLFQGITKEIRTLCVAGSSLFAGTLDGLYEIKGNNYRKVSNGIIRSLYYSENIKLLIVAGDQKVELYEHKGEWKKRSEIPEISEKVIAIEEYPGNTFWMGTALEGVIRLQFSADSNYKVDKFNSLEDGLDIYSWVIPMIVDGKIVFSQSTGLLTFIDEETLKASLPDSLKNKPEFSRGYFDFFNIDSLAEPAGTKFYATADTKDKLYVNLDNELGYFDKTNGKKWVTEPFRTTDIGKVNVFYHEGNNICWIGGDDGLIRFDESAFKNYESDYNSIIYHAACTGDSLLFSGYGINDLKQEPQLSYRFNTLSFNFCSPFFENQDKTQYSFMLAGQDTVLSQWQSSNKAVFSNLREGKYTFSVKAKNVYGKVSSESTFKFTIFPPWYRSILAYLMYVVLFFASVFGGIRINSRRLIEKNKKLEEVILERTHEIKQKNIVLEHQKQEILDSINYAQRIQKAVLPDDELTKNWLGEHFIIFRPKDIVSGDFYWATRTGDLVLFCVADCTGHGVPGAFMSMLCISFLNEVVLKDKITDSAEIFNRVRNLIIESLKQKGIEGEQKDGMDITLCILNKKTLELQYSGANNPLFVIRDKNKEGIPSDKVLEFNDRVLYEIKGDSMPIAIHVKMDPFKKNILKLQKGDRLYLFSDGIADQFGGPNGKKFMYKAFKNALLESCGMEMEMQKQKVEGVIEAWMSPLHNGQGYEQVDDICLMGVRI